MEGHHPMYTELLDFILHGRGDFEALALRLCAWQVAHNPVYAALVEGGAEVGPGAGSASPAGWRDIPTVPVDLFKELDLVSFPVEAPHTLFYTSGTTQGRRGAHRMLDTRLYDAGSALHAGRAAGIGGRPVVSLCPAAGGTSSLGHMVGLFGALSGSGVEGFFDAEAGVDARVWARLRAGGTVFLAATAFALDAAFALADGALAGGAGVSLGPESLVMVTGGFKGRRVRLDAPGLYAAIPGRLGAPSVVGEYGMTELSSQLWTEPVAAGAVPGAFVAPPWMRVYAVDPVTYAPVPAGSPGLLRFVDLANCWSVLGVETLDLGEVDPDPAGDRVRLIGRLSGAEARGCSLTAEDLIRR